MTTNTIRVTPACHAKLQRAQLDRGAALGRRVTLSEVIEEALLWATCPGLEIYDPGPIGLITGLSETSPGQSEYGLKMVNNPKPKDLPE